MNNVYPRLTMLSSEQIQDIHRYTLKLLATTGVQASIRHPLWRCCGNGLGIPWSRTELCGSLRNWSIGLWNHAADPGF